MALEPVDKLMQAGMLQGVYPGAVLLVSHEGEIVFHRAYGWADLFSRRPVSEGTCFDLASLTKPLATTLAAMHLVQSGLLDLDSPCVRYCAALDGTDIAQITIRQLLAHRSGLIPWRPYYMRLRRFPLETRSLHLRRWLRREACRFRPGECSDYSDVGFLLLQWILEDLLGRPLASFIDKTIYHPLGLTDLCLGGFKPIPTNHSIAATELCPWRNRLLVGEVHDDNASVLGGFAGHAGLFGTARAVHILLYGLLLGDVQQRGHQIFDTDLIRVFFQRQKGTDWALGFDTPSQRDSSAGQFFSPESVGHLGYTGTSFWLDRRQGVIVVLLTNRVHPSRYNFKIRSFRPSLHDAVMVSIGKGSKKPGQCAGSVRVE